MSNRDNSLGDNQVVDSGEVLPSLTSMVNRLRFKQVALLLALEEHGSLHKAADILHLSQPAVTKALHEMEAAFGITLFERSTRGMVATELGRCVIRYARLIQSDLSHLRDELSSILQGKGGRLSVGTIMGATPMVTRALVRLREIQPDTSVEITEDSSARQLLLLDQGKIELMIGRSSVSAHPQHYDFEELRGERMCIVSGINHPLAEARSLKVRDLIDSPWVLYSNNMPMRIWIESEFKLEGLAVPSNIVETASAFVTLALLLQSNMVAVMPLDIAYFFAARKMLCILPMQMKTKIEAYGIVTRKNANLSSIGKIFVNILRQQN